MQERPKYLSPGTSRVSLTQSQLIVFLSVILVLFYNQAFFRNVIEVYPLTLQHTLFIFSLGLLVTALVSLLLSLVSFRYTNRPLFILILIASSLSAYFMDSYNIVIDDSMLQNVAATSTSESLDLLSFKLVLYVLLLGVLPALFVYKVSIKQRPLRQEVFSKLKLVVIALLIIVAQLLMLGKTYASFFREHKPLTIHQSRVLSLFQREIPPAA